MEAVCPLFNAHLNVNECYQIHICGLKGFGSDKVGARGKWN